MSLPRGEAEEDMPFAQLSYKINVSVTLLRGRTVQIETSMDISR